MRVPTLTISQWQDRSLALTALISSAVHDPDPPYDLAHIARSIVLEELYTSIDALNVIPHLLPCPRKGTEDLLRIVGEYANAKEIVMAAQEISEHMHISFDEEDESESQSASRAIQVSRLIALHATAIPRLRLRKPASERLQAILPDLELLVTYVARNATVEEGRLLVSHAAQLVQRGAIWVGQISGSDSPEIKLNNAILSTFLDSTLEACADRLRSHIAQRTFEAYFPRLAASGSMGRTFSDLRSRSNIASLVLLAHYPPPQRITPADLTPLLPIILTSLQSNVGLDSSLAILLEIFCSTPADIHTSELSPDTLIPLATMLPPLCSVHPDPPTRHLTFRLLGQVLRWTPSLQRLQILCDLLSPSDNPMPQMRTAAVGLVKDAVIEALSPPSAATDTLATSNVFASPLLLQTLGSFIFRPDPPDLFASPPSLDEFQESNEPARLAECLGLYYVMLLRDVDSRTGVRDQSSTRNIESSLLGPLRSTLDVWIRDDTISGDPHRLLPLASLQMSVERIDAALKTLAA
ncbi:hypothetical protein BV25DRAFT_1799966 [Artomyces pyxidatus]|uniref:Uncharacterized protein n=1 Tax=Artomyces pyxidatus TaxID=48021 RepID=A0ACB8TAB8_9AGAM|nr:hypothetical protein BV25DRAFT_1799966 [Artomyces pyxidatus]